jgi:hypothetical protein
MSLRRNGMKEKLIELLKSKVGLDQEKAEKSVNTIFEHFKANPAEVTAFFEKEKLGAVAGKIGGVLS